MSSSNNLYPDLSHQPLLNQPSAKYTPPSQPAPNVAPYNYQGYAATNQTFPAYSQPHQQQPAPQAPQVVQGYQLVQNAPNQGFQPNGQVFPPSGQGLGPNGQLHCAFCGRWTDSFQKKQTGGVTYIWCLALFLLTGVCFWVPFCTSGCKDTLMVCVNCQREKARIQANCCC